MGFLKQRSRNKSVTAKASISVLVNAKPGERAAAATFLLTPLHVREFTDKDFEAALPRLRADERVHFLAVVEWIQAREANDPVALNKARERLAHALTRRREHDERIGLKQGDDGGPNFTRLVTNLFGLAPGQEAQAMDIWRGYSLSAREKDDPSWLLSHQLSDELCGVRLVLWWTGKRFLPALYCPHTTQALYVQALLKVVAGKGLAVCPHCGKPFVQERSDQQYCSMAHREAHRVARWRMTLRGQRAMKRAAERRKGTRRPVRKKAQARQAGKGTKR